MIDLHAHTKASDGEYSAQKLIDLAIDKNISTLAITDHDCVDSIQEAIDYSKDKNITIIPGIEISTKIDKGQMHILGLFVDYTSENLKEKLAFVTEDRVKRNKRFINMFNEMGYEITMEELKEISLGNVIGKPHFARIFIKKGYIKETEEMFQNYFNKPPFKGLGRFAYQPKETIEMIKEANGIPVLAHPQTLRLTYEELDEKLRELKEYGLEGLECYHSKQTPEEMGKFRELAIKYDLLITKGSDYHGPVVKPGIDLGTGIDGNILNNEEENIINNLQKNRNKTVTKL